MEDITISIVGIFISAIIMFIVPLMFTSDKADDIAQLTSQTAATNFVDNVIKSGKIVIDDYDDFRSMLATTGNMYDVEIEVKILDLNSVKNTEQNVYYSIFTSQIEDKFTKGDIILKEGDVFSVTVKNTSLTISQSLKNIYYKLRGENLHIIAATASGTVAINGAT